MDTKRVRGVSRRAMMKNALRAGAYAAPAILSLAAVAPVAAATPPPFPVTITFGQDAALIGTGANAIFDVYATLSTQPAGTLSLLGTLTTDAFGFGGTVFPLVVDTRAVTSVTLTYILHGNAPTSPPAATFTSALVAALGPVNGARGPVAFIGLVVQEPTAAACQVGPLNQFVEYVDAAILNAPPNTPYNLFVQPNTLAAPVSVTTAMTNAQGNVTVFAPTPTPVTSATPPTSVIVTAVPAGGGPTLTLTASGANLTTIGCGDLTHAARPNAVATVRALGIITR